MGAQNNSFIIHDLEGPLTGVYLSVIVPTYNESENIRWLLEALIATLDAQLPNDYEVIVVDDNSPDQTWKIVQELSSDSLYVGTITDKYTPVNGPSKS